MPQIIVQPFDAATNKAISIINQKKPSLLKNVERVVVHSSGGPELGHVAMGPGKNPREIHIFKNRIRDIVLRNANATIKKTLTSQELEQALVDGILETILHENIHIGPTKTPEQIAKGPFASESEAEQTTKSLMKQIKPANQSFKLSKRATTKVASKKKVNSFCISKRAMKITKEMIPTLWYENEKGDKHILTDDELKYLTPPPEGFIYQHSQFPLTLNHKVLRLIQKKEVDSCPHLEENIRPTGGWIDGVEGRKCIECNGDQIRNVGENWPEEWNSNGSVDIMSGTNSYPEDLVLAMVNSKDWKLNEAILIAANSCERCMNALAHKYGLKWGYPEFSDEWKKSNTVCDFCRDEPQYKRSVPKFNEKISEFILNSALTLDEIREKYLPNNKVIEPDLKFATYAANNNKAQIIRYGLSLIKNPKTSLVQDLNDAAGFNRNVLKNISNTKLYGPISQFSIHFNDYELVTNLAKWQESNQLKLTGKLDKNTIKKLCEFSAPKSFPQNFATVIPDVLYRGGLIMDESQLQALKDLGVQRVVALHSNPDVPRLCNKMGVEYVPAFIENGGPEDLGRKVFGNSVSKFLLQEPTYVFCFFGQDRTGGVIARLRTELGWPCDLAYREAKSFGFKDIFADLIDWFSEFCSKKPVDTNQIRKTLNGKNPYQNPEIVTQEQDCSLPTPAPNDVPFEDSEPTSFPSYKSYITSEIPTSISTIPLSIRSSIKTNAYEVRTQKSEEERDKDWKEDEEEPAVNINGLLESEEEINCNQGLSLEPFFDTESTGGTGVHS